MFKILDSFFFGLFLTGLGREYRLSWQSSQLLN